ncbi:MAG: hypothetical protein M1825_001702 [Sarcosagium campestre]|nr:MAG: hypothetical protein M1825_001702 [Sarcosagium campestre]
MPTDEFDAIKHHFNDLANDDEETRLDASLAILSGLDGAPTNAIRKALDRLLRGLASGRKSARIGFSITLTELLCRCYGPTTTNHDNALEFGDVLDRFKSSTKAHSSVSGQEERDHSFGRLFGLEAILKSHILLNGSELGPFWPQVLDLVFEIAKQKQWLREECGWILYEALRAAEGYANGEAFTKVALQRLCANSLAISPEGVAIWILAIETYPSLKFPKDIWRNRDPLNFRNASELAKVLKESSSPKTDSKTESKGPQTSEHQRGTWIPKPHFVWGVIFRNLCRPKSPESDTSRMPFADFWRTSIDESLFSASSSQERKHWGMLLFSEIIRDAPKEYIRDVFTKNMTRCIINQLSNGERYLHRTAVRSLKDVHTRLASDPDLALDVVTGLETGNGAYNFDQITKTKTIGSILAATDSKTMLKIIDLFEKAIQGPGKDDVKGVEATRQSFADQIVSALRSRKLDAAEAWITKSLQLFARLGYFKAITAEDQAIPVLSSASQAMFRARLSSSFAHLMSIDDTESTIWAYEVLRYMKALEKRPNEYSSLVEFDGKINKARTSARKRMKELHDSEFQVEEQQRLPIRSFRLLYSLVLFQLYNGDSEALDILSEIQACHKGLIERPEGNGSNAAQSLVELLLGLLSQRSVLLRRVVQTTFASLTGSIDEEALQLLFDVLKTQESSSGQQNLFDQDVGDEIGSDVEMMDMSSPEVKRNKSNGARESDSDEDGYESDVTEADDNEDEDDEDDAEDEELTNFNAALAAVIGTKPFNEAEMTGATAAAADSDTSSSDDEQMTDDAMFALDAKVAEVFKQQKMVRGEKKRSNRDAKESVVNLKNRVLDLLEIYIRHQHANPLCLTIILPLLALNRSTTSKQISNRTGGVLRELAQKCKSRAMPTSTITAGGKCSKGISSDISSGSNNGGSSDDDDDDNSKDHHLWKILKEVHEEAHRDASRAHASACSACSLLLTRTLVALDQRNLERVVALYGATQLRWLKGDIRVQPLLFSNFINWSTSYSKQS